MSSPRRRVSATAEQPLGADRELALLHVPSRVREPFAALFALDSAMGDVVARTTEPALGRIKLAWWREQLQALDEAPPPAEPRLIAVAANLLPLGVLGADVAELEAGWATLLDSEVDAGLVAGRGEALFEIGAALLGSEDARLADAGALYALASVGRRGMPQLFEPARDRLARLAGHRFGRRLRPLTMLARAAARDLTRDEPEGSARRAAAMIAHRWSGRIC